MRSDPLPTIGPDSPSALPGPPAARFSRRRPAGLARGLKSGLTLVELLVVTVVTILVVGAAVSLYSLNSRYYVMQEALLEQVQNLRMALYQVARDARMAGNGFNLLGVEQIQIYVNGDYYALGSPDTSGEGGWFLYREAAQSGVRPVYGFDGGTDGPDSLTVFYTGLETAAAVGRLAASFNTTQSDGSNQLSIKGPIGADLRDGDIVAVVNGSTAVIVEAGAVAESESGDLLALTIGSRFRPGDGAASGWEPDLPAGSLVYNLRDITFVTYYLDAARNCLVANYHSDINPDSPLSDEGREVVVANNIEDFQVAYILNDPDASGNPLESLTAAESAEYQITEGLLSDKTRWVRAVRLALVSKSSIKNEVTSGSSSHDYSADLQTVFNRRSVPVRDGYQRRILTETVYLRNY